MRSSTVQLLAVFILFLQTWAAFGEYKLVRSHSGHDFFSQWDFDSGIDNTTGGNVQYVDHNTATQQRLAFVDASTRHTFIRVDNTTKIQAGPSVHRNSVKIISKDAYSIGSLIILDAIHIPYGCSVWPTFWILGTELAWPQSFDISQSGKTLDRDRVGCKVDETKPNNYGEEFAQAGGGVFAAQIDVSGIFLWFWSRSDIPVSILNAKPDAFMNISDWGQPITACDIGKFSKPQKLVLDITLCGQRAGPGVPSVYAETCPDKCIENVIGDGSNYGSAFWEISYIRTFAARPGTSANRTIWPRYAASFPLFHPSTPNQAPSSVRSLDPPVLTSTSVPTAGSSTPSSIITTSISIPDLSTIISPSSIANVAITLGSLTSVSKSVDDPDPLILPTAIVTVSDVSIVSFASSVINDPTGSLINAATAVSKPTSSSSSSAPKTTGLSVNTARPTNHGATSNLEISDTPLESNPTSSSSSSAKHSLDTTLLSMAIPSLLIIILRISLMLVLL